MGIALFGSVARGQARPDSDLDLYVVTRRPTLGDPRLRRMWGRIDASPEYQALGQAGYRPTPSPIPHTVDDLVHPDLLHARSRGDAIETSSRELAVNEMSVDYPKTHLRKALTFTAAFPRR